MATVVALSSGLPPAAIAIVRISGPVAFAAAAMLIGTLPPARRASLRALRDAGGNLLDRALVLAFPAASSATGEDLVELHCHGGRATVNAVIRALLIQPDVRAAEPGEFTRQALGNGRIDLAQAEGLADLLEAETEAQRRTALAASEGVVSQALKGWLDGIMALAAQVEAVLDFADEDDVARDDQLFSRTVTEAASLYREIKAVLAAPPIDRIRDGLRVVIAGPPNSGKSTLLNLMSDSDAAIVSPHAGTTRDRIEVPVRRGDHAYRLTDTAGLTETDNPVERIGVDRAGAAIASADLVLWLGDDEPPRADAILVHARCDLMGRSALPSRRFATRYDDLQSIDALWKEVGNRAVRLLPRPTDMLLRTNQRQACSLAADELILASDPLIAAEQLRLAGGLIARLLGLNATESMLFTLFSRFCVGK